MPRQQSSWGQHGAHLGPVGPRWAPCCPHEPCYQGGLANCLLHGSISQTKFILLTTLWYHYFDRSVVATFSDWKVEHDDGMTWKRFPHYCPFERNPRMIDVKPWCFICCYPERGVQWTVQLPVIWDSIGIMWRNWDEHIVTVGLITRQIFVSYFVYSMVCRLVCAFL